MSVQDRTRPDPAGAFESDIYRLAALQTADHWMITDVDGVVIEVNSAFEKVTGYSQSELIGKKPNLLRSGVHDRAFYEAMWKTILAGEPYKGVVINRRKNGELFHELKSITPIRDTQGRITHFFSIAKDITEIKEAEARLEKSASEIAHINYKLAVSETDLLRHIRILESVLSSSNEGVVVADRDGRFIMFSQAAKEIIGIGPSSGPPSEWSGSYGVFLKDMKTPFPSEELPLVRAIRGERTDDMEMFLRNPAKPDGVWLNVSGRPLSDAQGNLMGGVIVARDVTQDHWVKEASAALKANHEEMQIAERVQKRLFPKMPPVIEGLEIGGASRSAVVTGGDYYDYIRTPDGSLLLVVGDVSGHGYGPALLMASVRAYIRALAAYGLDAKEILAVVNRLIAQDTSVEDYVTLFLVRVDPATRKCEYTSAGHPAGYVLDGEGRIRQPLRSTLPPLGILPEIGSKDLTPFEIDAGDLLVMVTDGMVEAESSGGEVFGEDSVIRTVREHRQYSPSEIVSALHGKVAAHCGGKLQDDITSIIVRFGARVQE